MLAGDSVQARLLRTFMPLVLLIIIINGWFDTLFQESLAINPALAAALGALGFLAISSVLIIRQSRRIGGEIDRANEARRRAQLQLRKTVIELERSNEELQQFAYVASHDLQEPLRMVTSYMQLLQRRYQDMLDDDANEFIGFAVEGANRMRDLILDLLQLSRVETKGGKFVEVDSGELLDAAQSNLEIAIKESGASISHGPLPRIKGDPAQLTQLLQNLIGNAIKFRGDAPPQVQVSAQTRIPNGFSR